MIVSEWNHTGQTALLVVNADEEALPVVDAMLESPCHREVYISDASGVIQGYIPLRELLKPVLGPVFFRSFAGRDMLDYGTKPNASDLMEADFPRSTQEDDLVGALARMLEYDVSHMPVVDWTGSAVGALAVDDLLRAWRDGLLG